jgi:transcriptional regulator with XRE-family HTH domain
MTGPGVGELLRDWRLRRRRSQLDLAIEADISARHLSFVETGRSTPSRDLLLHLAEHLDVPLRERNAWLLAAGYAPVYRETPLDDARMAPVRAALDKILDSHEPYPAVIVDHCWNVVSANDRATAILTDRVAPHLLAGPVNALRVSLHPDGLAPRIANLAEYSAHVLARLQRQSILSADPAMTALHEELREYPGVSTGHSTAVDTAAMLFVPLVLDVSDTVRLTFFSTLATFGTALDITLAELSIESFLPADTATAAYLRG